MQWAEIERGGIHNRLCEGISPGVSDRADRPKESGSSSTCKNAPGDSAARSLFPLAYEVKCAQGCRLNNVETRCNIAYMRKTLRNDRCGAFGHIYDKEYTHKAKRRIKAFAELIRR